VLSLDPIAEARRQWDLRWEGGAVMARSHLDHAGPADCPARVDEVLRPYELTFARYEALVLLSFSRRGPCPWARWASG